MTKACAGRRGRGQLPEREPSQPAQRDVRLRVLQKDRARARGRQRITSRDAEGRSRQSSEISMNRSPCRGRSGSTRRCARRAGTGTDPPVSGSRQGGSQSPTGKRERGPLAQAPPLSSPALEELPDRNREQPESAHSPDHPPGTHRHPTRRSDLDLPNLQRSGLRGLHQPGLWTGQERSHSLAA